MFPVSPFFSPPKLIPSIIDCVPDVVTTGAIFPIAAPPNRKIAIPRRHSDKWVLGLIGPSIVGTRFHAQMYALAEFYSAPELKEAAKQKFASRASVLWRTKDFVNAIKVVYTSTLPSDTGLRDIVINTIASHKELLDFPEVEDVLKMYPDLGFQVLQACTRKD